MKLPTGRFIDIAKWKRREHFRLYRAYERPFFSLSVELDVTEVWNRARKTGAAPFLLASLFFMVRAANEIEAFRLRLRRRGVWLHHRVGVGTTVLRPNETFGFARIESANSLDRFVRQGGRAITTGQSQTSLDTNEAGDDLVYHSSIPWLRFTSFTNALRRGDSIPRVVFGKCERSGRTVRMPVAVEVHHALVDGLDVARFLERFQEGLYGAADIS